jgi:glucose-1-phosphate thymidylyltransferase
MNVIVPMAGMGKRLRPHTLMTPKPLIHVAGKPIVQRLVEEIVKVSDQKIDHIAFVTGHFGEAAEKHLLEVATTLGAKGSIHYQEEALGTAHAVLCAADHLNGPITVAFADTLFKANFSLDENADGMLWVQRIDDPRQFGVVVTDQEGTILEFVEKPQTFVSDLAMIGIYYFKNGEWLKKELQYLLDHNITHGGEYQLPDALRNMMKQGAKFTPGTVNDWMDCGNKTAVVETNQKILGYEPQYAQAIEIGENSQIIPPCYIADNVVLKNAIIGPYVSLENGVKVMNSKIENSIVNANTTISDCEIENAMIGSHCFIKSYNGNLNLGDYSTIGQVD